MNERQVVNWLMRILGAGCQWAALPKDLPPPAGGSDRGRHVCLWGKAPESRPSTSGQDQPAPAPGHRCLPFGSNRPKADGRLSATFGRSARGQEGLLWIENKNSIGDAITPAFCIDMWTTCTHHLSMNVMIQIRHVPEALHRQLKSRAALAGMSLSDYLLNEIRQVAERPGLDELRARMERRAATVPSVAPAEAVRAERDRI